MLYYVMKPNYIWYDTILCKNTHNTHPNTHLGVKSHPKVIHVTLVLIEIFTSIFLIILFFQDKSFGNDNESVSTVVFKQMGKPMPTHPLAGKR